MKICLINPQYSTTNDPTLSQIFERISKVSGYVESIKNAISSGLLIIAALTPEEHEIIFVDDNHEEIDYTQKYDIVGISTTTQQATRAYEIADEFQKRGISVVIGGIHATVMPQEVKKHCDVVFIGEAEETWPQFLKEFESNQHKEFYHCKHPVDLSQSTMPRYDLLNKDYYKVIWVQTSRGCPHDCEFCAATKIYGFKYRTKSVAQVVSELQYIKRLWNDIKIDFADDNLFSNRKYARRLLSEIKKMNIKWYAQTDISVARDEQFVEEIKAAGCLTLLVGFESVSPQSLETINKNQWKLKQLPRYPESIALIQSKGIGVIGAFIIGFDTDTKNTFNDLANFIIDNNIFVSQIAILTPFPGTKLYEKYKAEGRLMGKKWRDFTGLQVTFSPKNMSIEELQHAHYELYSKIYNEEVRLKVMDHFKKICMNNLLKKKQAEHK
ncbi:B12-binding domain-containing radical SAM protein [candidate division KSB1 bacterium]|nr:B12-binding domain-containing radical SAM protein [candidate division KSB1 bacterium]